MFKLQGEEARPYADTIQKVAGFVQQLVWNGGLEQLTLEHSQQVCMVAVSGQAQMAYDNTVVGFRQSFKLVQRTPQTSSSSSVLAVEDIIRHYAIDDTKLMIDS
jgi:hypothetical protein